MTNIENNDKRIIDLKKKIEDKKKDLKSKKSRFIPVTNCNLSLDGNNYNLHVSTKDDLILILTKLNMYFNSSKELGYENELKLRNFTVSEWMEDVKSRISVENYKEEEKTLKELENKLTKLLSSEKRTELELDSIESLLK